jgi:hypothetical protein
VTQLVLLLHAAADPAYVANPPAPDPATTAEPAPNADPAVAVPTETSC